MPRADHFPPDFAVELTEDPTKGNALRVKGGGEAGITPSSAVLINAVLDALSDIGIEHIDMPATPQRLWAAIRAARGRAAKTTGVRPFTPSHRPTRDAMIVQQEFPMPECFVAKASDLQDGDRRIVVAGREEVGVFFKGGAYYAYSNYCVHAGGPACEGIMVNRVVDVIADDRTYQGQTFWRQGAFRVPVARLRIRAQDRSVRRRPRLKPAANTTSSSAATKSTSYLNRA